MVLLHRGAEQPQPTLPQVGAWKLPLAGHVKPFVVSEESMLPTLEPGDGLVALRTRRLRRGEVRCFEHPDRPGFWLVKRVGHVRGTTFEARSDHTIDGTVESRTFGFVPVEHSYRVILRIPARFLS